MRKMERVAFAPILNVGLCFGLVKPIFNSASNVLFYIIIMKRAETERERKRGGKKKEGEVGGVSLL